MDFALTAEQEALRSELRAYYADLLTTDVQQKLADGLMGDDAWKTVVKQIAADGWLGIGWPTEYGGQNRSAIEQLIFFDETQRAEAPVPMLSINTVGPTIMQFGTDEQKARFLPGILAGELNFSVGYTEPAAGTDLASLQTRAVRDGDEYVINGQKVFTSLAAFADYVWLAARTDTEARKHRGISIFLVPTDDPGFSFQPMDIMSIGDTTVTFYDDVRVPVANRVGEENQGWKLITNQLNHERVAICNAGLIWRYLDEVSAFAAEHDDPDGRGRLIDREWVRLSLARVRSRAEVLQLLNWKVAAGLTAGGLDPAVASATKVFGTEAYIETLGLLMEIIGPRSYLREDSPGAVLGGRMERSYQGILVLTFGGGTNEIQRDIIAMLGLGLPRADR
jgi:alkylation response protein AidB-like acyl-CoA dehydrogenase